MTHPSPPDRPGDDHPGDDRLRDRPHDAEHAADAAPRPTVLLRHELPDGSFHYDWMIARDPAGTGPLETMRLFVRLDRARPGDELDAVPIADHRPAWLEREGEVSGGRGRAMRVARGTVVAGEDAGGLRRLEIRWAGRSTSTCVRLPHPTPGAVALRLRVVA